MVIKNKIPKYILNIMDIIEDNGYKCYLVGGSIRDILLNNNPKDYDLASSATPSQIKNIFNHVILTGEKHGTVTVVTDNGNVEITTLRRDGDYTDNRRPDVVRFTDDITEDLSRRDFTINAMAYNLKEGLIDFYCGKLNLQNKIIKTVGNSDDRFNEDALRMLRAIRFACQLGFAINYWTYNSICTNNVLIKNISAERIKDELCKILISDNPSYGIKTMVDTGLMQHIIPELIKCVDFDQKNPAHHKNVFDHTLLAVENTSNNLILRLAALLHDIGKPETFTLDENNIGHFYSHHMRGMDIGREILQRLKFDNKTIETVCILIKEHMSRYDFLRTSNIKKFINRVGVDNLSNLFELQIADIKASKFPHDINGILKLKGEVNKVLEEKQPLTVKDLAINGYDLMDLGIKPGKEMGEILNELLEMILENPELNNKDDLVNIAKNECQ